MLRIPEIARFPGSGYPIAVLLTAMALVVRLLMAPVDAGLQYITFFPAVTLTAFIAGFWPGMLAMVLGILFATFIFTFPYYSVSAEAIRGSIWSNLVFAMDGLIVCLSIEAMHRYRVKYAEELIESKRAHEETLRQTRQLKDIFENVLDGIIVIDESGSIISFNKAAERIFQYDATDVVGRNISMLMPEPYRSRHGQYLDHYLATGEKRLIGIGREVEGLRRDGSAFPMELSVCEISVGERLHTGIVRDISKRKAYEEDMRRLAHHDQLTGLPNRTLFADRLNQALSLARRDRGKIAVMLLDLDKFKSINDTFGHEAGDLLLKQVAGRLLQSLRESDTAARLGGDEFVMLLPTIESGQDALLIAQKIAQALKQPFDLDGQILGITASIGLAIHPEHGDDEKTLMRHADIAMYKAKAAENGIILTYSPDMELN